MNKNSFFIIIFSLILISYSIFSRASITLSESVSKKNEEQTSVIFDDITGLITIDYNKEPITNILYFLQSIKNINLIVPHGSASMKETVTFKSERPFSIEEFYSWVVTVLDQMGYIITNRPNNLVIGQKTAENLREPVDLFVAVPLEKIPNSDQLIRYIYYVANGKVSLSTESEFNVLVKEFLSPTGIFRVDVNANAYVIADRANNIRTVVQFLEELDMPIQQETVDFINLSHAEASMVVPLLTELVNTKLPGVEADVQGPKGLLDSRKQSDLLYFAKGTKIFPILHNNSIMLLGKQQAINQIKKFVKEEIDQEIGYGNSILHVYSLQYTNASSLGPTLQRLVDASRVGGTGQSEGQTQGGTIKGNERLFDEIIIQADCPANPEERQYFGGNNLIFGCTNDDYQQVKQLVAELDTPPALILLEIAIADLSSEDNRILGSITRNPEKLALLSSMQFQSSQLAPGIILDNFNAPTTVASDILQNSINNSGSFVDTATATNSVAALTPAGGTVVSFNDLSGKTWSMLQILKFFTYSKIIQHPHVITVDNKPCLVKIGEARLLPDETTNSASGVAVQQTKQINADLKIEITPRKSADGTVTLNINITIDDFEGTQGNKITRATQTTVNVESGSIFAISGLSKVTRSEGVSKVPLIGDIPLLGWFGKSQNGDTVQSNLSIFISATIIEPRLRSGIGEYTQSYIDMARDFGQDSGLFNSAKDPITRWFFSNQTTQDINEALDSFVQHHFKNTNHPIEFLNLDSVPMPDESELFDYAKMDRTEKLKDLLTTITENPFIHEEKIVAT